MASTARPRLSRRLLRTLEIAAATYTRMAGGQRAAAISYRVLFSLVPFVALLVSVLELVLPETTQQSVVSWLVGVASLPDEVSQSVDAAVKDAGPPASATGAVALAALIWAASGMMASVRSAFRAVWDSEADRPYLRGKLVDFVLVLGAGVLVVSAFGLSLVVQVVTETSSEIAAKLGRGESATAGLGAVVQLGASLTLALARFRVPLSVRPSGAGARPGRRAGRGRGRRRRASGERRVLDLPVPLRRLQQRLWAAWHDPRVPAAGVRRSRHPAPGRVRRCCLARDRDGAGKRRRRRCRFARRLVRAARGLVVRDRRRVTSNHGCRRSEHRRASPDRARPRSLDLQVDRAGVHPRSQRRRPLAERGGRGGVRRSSRQANRSDRRARLRDARAAGVRRQDARDGRSVGGNGRRADGRRPTRHRRGQLDDGARSGFDRRRLRSRRSHRRSTEAVDRHRACHTAPDGCAPAPRSGPLDGAPSRRSSASPRRRSGTTSARSSPVLEFTPVSKLSSGRTSSAFSRALFDPSGSRRVRSMRESDAGSGGCPRPLLLSSDPRGCPAPDPRLVPGASAADLRGGRRRTGRRFLRGSPPARVAAR